MNELVRHNEQSRREVEAFRDRHHATYRTSMFPKFDAYPLPELERRIAQALSAARGERIEPQVELIERAVYGGDVSLKFPQLLRNGGPKAFVANHVPWIVEILSGPAFADVIARVETKGMYINVVLANRWLLDGAWFVTRAGSEFGRSDSMAGRNVVVDYSSPNVAKVLHAGHIRSTIVGHVLSNLYEANGALVYRVNHINDFGGFGFTLEGYRRFMERFPETLSDNERLVEIYRIRRTVERILEAGKPLDALDDGEREVLSRYFVDAANLDELRDAFAAFTATADARFASLEAGAEDEVALWREMVRWSLSEFDRFYDALNIHFDLVIGESFYFQAGDALVDRLLASEKALVYTEAAANTDLARLDARLAAGTITATERESLAGLITKDVGAVVIRLDRDERYVVRRADGRSIYATRDLGAIELRREIFDATDLVYVVGQEQRVHFDRLFRAAYAVGLVSPGEVRFNHLYFGFYVDAVTGKKLSSRDSVANVVLLLAESVNYFRSRLSDRVDQSLPELERAANQLAVGSLVFNDLKQDIKGSVEFETANIESTLATFEKSGGAYVVYAACRARSILRRYGRELVDDAAETIELDDQEVELLLKVQQTPLKVAAAASQSNPSVLVRHLLDIANVYNSYYTRAPVFVDGIANATRLVITQAVAQSLINGLLFCHVECPEAI